MDLTATDVSNVVVDPAKSPIACDAKAAPEYAPAIFGFVQLPEVCPMPGTELTGDGATDTAAGQNTLCALADRVERKVAPRASPSANVAPTVLARETIAMHAVPGKRPNSDDSMTFESSLCFF
jgi:hypothetical protein